MLLSVLDAETQALRPGLAARTAPPTRASLQQALGRLNARMAEDKARGDIPVLYFIFTGHGQRGAAGEGAVSLLDGAFTRTDLYNQVLAPSRASLIHLIVDACDSYFFVHSRGALPMAPARFEAVRERLAMRELARYPHVGAVLSTSREQESHEWSAIRSGVFSHQVLSALAGAADVNADGRVEYSELQAFIAAANQGVDDVRGRLEVSIQPPALDRAAPLVDLSQRTGLGFLLLAPGLEGRVWVEDTRGIRVAELNKERERSLVLGLPPGRGYFLRAPGREAPFQLARAGAVVDARGLTGASSPSRHAAPWRTPSGTSSSPCPSGPTSTRATWPASASPPWRPSNRRTSPHEPRGAGAGAHAGPDPLPGRARGARALPAGGDVDGRGPAGGGPRAPRGGGASRRVPGVAGGHGGADEGTGRPAHQLLGRGVPGAQVLALGAQRLVRGVALGVGGTRGVALTLVDREGLESHATLELSPAEAVSGPDETRAREALGSLWAARTGRRVDERPARVLPTVLVTAGGVALAVGVGFGLAARQSQKTLSTGAADCGGEGPAFRECFAARLREGRSRATTANVLLGTGALLGAGGTVFFLWEWP
ncbi:hypothetical protein ACN28S_62035 [Cystobacter fuscus]